MNPSLHKMLPVGIIVASLLFFVAVLIWGIIPFQNVIVDRSNTMEADRALQANRESRTKELPQLRERYNRILENEQKFDTMVSHDQTVPFIEHIESLAHDTGVDITITNQDQPAQKKKPQASASGDSDNPSPGGKKKKDDTLIGNLPLNAYMSLRLTVHGAYPKVAEFLYHLEALPYAIDVVAIDIRRWEPSDSVSRGDTFGIARPVLGEAGSSSDAAPEPDHLVEGLLDMVVYTKE